MSASYLAAVRQRTLDQPLSSLSPKYMALALAMSPVVRSLLVDNKDPSHFSALELLCALNQDGSKHDIASRLHDCVRSIPGVLDAEQCGVLRAAVDAAPMEILDSVDGLLEYQLNLKPAMLVALIGIEAYERLNGIAAQSHRELSPRPSATAAAAALAAGIELETSLPDEPHEVFVRRYSSRTRPWFGFHHDRSSLTMNISLSNDDDHIGGRLLAIMDGQVRCCERVEGMATLHASTLLHAVTRMVGDGARYSLILFYRQICPHAGHTLVPCDARTMTLLYPSDQGSYSCDVCGDPASALDGCEMWHCAEGCEYDVCGPCHAVSLADGVEYVSVHR